MSFKSKQRAKHGHLFGDDPLSATLVNTSDDPLFGSKRLPNSTMTKSASVVDDPLSRLISNENGPLEISSAHSSPSISRRSVKLNGTHSNSSSSNSSLNSSIFGDIDVSKLGTGNAGFSGTNNKKTASTSLRSTTTLRSSKLNLDEEEDLLFGGHRHSASKPKITQKVTTTTQSISSPSVSTTPSVRTSIEKQPIPSAFSPPKKSPILSSNILSTPLEPEKEIIIKEQPIKEQKPKEQPNIPQLPKPEQTAPPPEPKEVKEIPKKEEKPTVSSSTSSFFKFFKSSAQQSSKSASSASSSTSTNAPTPKADEVVNNTVTHPITQEPPYKSQIEPPSSSRQAEVQANSSKSNIYKNIKHIITKSVEPKVEEPEEPETPQFILDEATRAFAEDDLFTKPTSTVPRFDYRTIAPEVTIDALTISPQNKKINPSISTPTRVDDPWSEIPTSSHFTLEPSMSSPLTVKVQDIEPQKRSAFADLINSWNTGAPTNGNFSIRGNDTDTFYDHIAEERRDVGFAGIGGSDDDTPNKEMSTVVDWDVEAENPWS